MKSQNHLATIAAISALIVSMSFAPGPALAIGRLGNGPNLSTLDGYANGTATDERSGIGCEDAAAPNLACPVGDFCSCITSTAAFKGISTTPGMLSTEINLDFSNELALYGTPNGSGGFCFGATGIARAITPIGDAIDMTLQGTVCDVTPVGVAPNQVFGAAFIGNYSITGGTGRFTGQAGTGSFSEMVSDVNMSSSPATFTAVGSSGH
jgi:hypothetical protein